MPDKIFSHKCSVCGQILATLDDAIICEHSHFDLSKLKDGIILLDKDKKDHAAC